MNEQDTAKGNRSQELCRRVVTTESFIAEAKEIYGDRYDYSKVDYKNRDNRVIVTCPVHGDFQVYAREHLDGKGCPKCEKGEKFIAKLKEKFGDKFGLDEFVYESSTTPVTLICPTHGAFSKLPNQILNLQFGCPHCGNDAKEVIHNAAVAKKQAAKEEKQRAMDEKSGMNFSEYMALLSGNTDLLDKAKLEKRIASLEGERKSFNKGKRDSEFKLESKTGELRNNTAFIDAMTEDWNRFLSVMQTDKEGNRLNIIKVDGVDSADEKVIGKRLQEIAKNATTGGLYTQVGELYGFPIKVVSERILKEGLEFTDNRFVVEGNYKYTYNNGHLAMADPLAAARNFLNAMERIPSIIDQYKAKNEVLEMEIPQLQEIAGKVWKKEDELKQLKSELAALDRKIQLELAPPTPEVAEKENEGQQLKPEAEDVRNRQAQYPENAPPQIRSPADSIVANHVIIGRPGLYAKEETRSKGLKI